MAIKERECERPECKKKFYGTDTAKYCSNYCRLAAWRKSKKANKDE